MGAVSTVDKCIELCETAVDEPCFAIEYNEENGMCDLFVSSVTHYKKMTGRVCAIDSSKQDGSLGDAEQHGAAVMLTYEEESSYDTVDYKPSTAPVVAICAIIAACVAALMSTVVIAKRVARNKTPVIESVGLLDKST